MKEKEKIIRGHIEDILATLPELPGVYLMKDSRENIIYVGKAISLKNRVRSYFRSIENHPPKVRAMVRNITDIEYIIVSTEVEALILENNLIKQYRPRYNILLKDDKQYPYIRVDRADPYPRIDIVRRVKNDGAEYYGPFLSALNLREVMDAVASYFPLRACKRDILRSIERKERPCLNYQIGRCIGPCRGNVESGEYHAMVDQVLAILQGDYAKMEALFELEMNQAAENLEYEAAASWRDKLHAIQRMAQRQHVDQASTQDNWDIFALARHNDDGMVQELVVRKGKLIGTEQYMMEDIVEEKDEDVLQAFLQQHYSVAPALPKEVLLQMPIPEEELIETWLSEKKESRVYLKVPQRGEKKRLVEMAKKNAKEGIIKRRERQRRDYERNEGAIIELADVLGLDFPPQRIECFDISNFQGVDNVASMVVMENGRAKRSAYRRFRIKTVDGQDDFKSMHEVVKRRLLRAMETDDASQHAFGELPDLIVVDGGKGQLSSGLKAMQETGFEIPMIGLAERLEEIYLPYCEETILLDRRSPALFALERLRDEAHRFAITYHRSLRADRTLVSELDEVAGIGKVRKQALLKHFKSIEQIKAASVEALQEVDSMTENAANAVFDYFRQQEKEEHQQDAKRI